MLFEFLELVERRKQGPRARLFFIREKAKDATAAAERGLEPVDHLDAFRSGARHMARRGALGIGAEAAWTRSAGVLLQRGGDGVRSAHRADTPREGEDVAPMAVAMEEVRERLGVSLR